MSYTVENVNGCTKKLVFNFQTLDLTNEIKAALVKKQKSANLKGFRKGKAPLAMVEKLYRPQVESEALNSFVQNQFYEAVQKEELRVVGYPSIENMKYDAGTSVSFDALVEIFPEVQIKDMSSLAFTRDSVEVNAEDVDKLIQNYLEGKSEMRELEDAGAGLAKGHFAVMNFQGEKEDGSRPENMKGEEFLLEIGSGNFIPGFEDGMIGMKKGEKKVVELTFPAEYHMAELRDAKVKFDVELLEIKEKKFPELTDELAKEFGYESVADMQAKNKDTLVQQKARTADEKLHQQILEKVIAENEFDIPSTLVSQQEEHLKQDLTRTLKQQGFTDDMTGEYFSRWSEDLNTKAQFQVRSGLLLDKLAKEWNIETTDEDFNKKIEETALMAKVDAEQVKKYYNSDPQIKNNLRFAIREEKTFDKIKEIVKVVQA